MCNMHHWLRGMNIGHPCTKCRRIQVLSTNLFTGAWNREELCSGSISSTNARIVSRQTTALDGVRY